MYCSVKTDDGNDAVLHLAQVTWHTCASSHQIHAARFTGH